MEHNIDFAQRELCDVDRHLTYRLERVAANELYWKFGFEKSGTSIYRMKVID